MCMYIMCLIVPDVLHINTLGDNVNTLSDNVLPGNVFILYVICHKMTLFNENKARYDIRMGMHHTLMCKYITFIF
jgi:hypothetical protein